eukprot:TRINITY_DN4595_c0_g1_i5.p1 TRINITY_DN4595_c0_g1~~TRINITY_DN4595_c0_g1_i5.p1  ORF type:complete len:407 (-),score=128.39 TRINITY_DN4595_c0_g1_i5:1287-2507(-)
MNRDKQRMVDSSLVCARIHFLLANYSQAETLLKNALKIQSKSKEAAYWLGLVSFYSYRNEPTDKDKAHKAKKAQSYLLDYLSVRIKEPKKDSGDVMLLWCLLVLTLELQGTYKHLKVKPKNKAEAYSYQIKRIDEYLGYIAWTEMYTYSSDTTKLNDCKDVLRELVTNYPGRPEAYLKLWALYVKMERLEDSIDIAERLFIEGTEYEGDEVTNVIVLCYVRSLIATKHELLAFQKIQYQYTIQTETPILLYYYGKFIAKCKDETLRKSFLGSALSSLQECIRSCLPHRHTKVYYWMGRIYEERKDIVNALFCYGKAVKGVKKGSTKYNVIAKYIDSYREFQAKSNAIAQKVSLGKFGHLTTDTKAKMQESLKPIEDEFIVIQKYDSMYAIYLKILYEFYVNSTLRI